MHEGGFEVARASDRVTFIGPDGRRLDASPPLAWRGTHHHDDTIGAQSLPCWDGTPFSLVYTMDTLRGSDAMASFK